ncbi:MAG: hypothetical protein M3O22_06660, partial [Pseudomonadota bacterium]|nr:hypothetical protein [Pseudomonadota bacterium]
MKRRYPAAVVALTASGLVGVLALCGQEIPAEGVAAGDSRVTVVPTPAFRQPLAGSAISFPAVTEVDTLPASEEKRTAESRLARTVSQDAVSDTEGDFNPEKALILLRDDSASVSDRILTLQEKLDAQFRHLGREAVIS